MFASRYARSIGSRLGLAAVDSPLNDGRQTLLVSPLQHRAPRHCCICPHPWRTRTSTAAQVGAAAHHGQKATTTNAGLFCRGARGTARPLTRRPACAAQRPHLYVETRCLPLWLRLCVRSHNAWRCCVHASRALGGHPDMISSAASQERKAARAALATAGTATKVAAEQSVDPRKQRCGAEQGRFDDITAENGVE